MARRSWRTRRPTPCSIAARGRWARRRCWPAWRRCWRCRPSGREGTNAPIRSVAPLAFTIATTALAQEAKPIDPSALGQARIAAFHDTPVGGRMIREMQALLSETMSVAQTMALKATTEVMIKLRPEIEKRNLNLGPGPN